MEYDAVPIRRSFAFADTAQPSKGGVGCSGAPVVLMYHSLFGEAMPSASFRMHQTLPSLEYHSNARPGDCWPSASILFINCGLPEYSSLVNHIRNHIHAKFIHFQEPTIAEIQLPAWLRLAAGHPGVLQTSYVGTGPSLPDLAPTNQPTPLDSDFFDPTLHL